MWRTTCGSDQIARHAAKSSGRWARRRKRAVSMFGAATNDGRAAVSMRSAVRFGDAPRARQLVEYAVDVGVALLGTEAFGDFHRFVQHHAIRHVDAMLQDRKSTRLNSSHPSI